MLDDYFVGFFFSFRLILQISRFKKKNVIWPFGL